VGTGAKVSAEDALARAVERLIARGHPALDYTPAQVVAFSGLAVRNQATDLLSTMNVTRMAYHGENGQIKKLARQLDG
jgi:hypothetical protein